MTDGRKRKWWLIPIVIVITAAVLAALFWDTVAVYLAPKTVLSASLTNTVTALQTRFADSPVPVFTKVMDSSGKNTIEMQLDTSNEFMGEILYDMTVLTQASPRRVFAEGTATTNGSALDIELFMDGDFAALSSDSLLQGNYYGITYDTFSQDIRKKMLLSLLVGDATIAQWEAGVASLQEQMNKSFELPHVSGEDIQTILMGIMALKADVSREVLNLYGMEQNCFVISFQATGAQINEGLNYIQADVPVEIDTNFSVTVAFFVCEDTVVRTTLEAFSDAGEYTMTLITGKDAASDDLSLSVVRRLDDSLESVTATVSTANDAAHYAEKINITQTVNGVHTQTFIDYDWMHTTGDTQLEVTNGGKSHNLMINLSETDTGFRLETGDFEALMAILTGGEDNADSHCILTVSKGSEFATPSYKNFDQWSMEDILILFGSIGSLFGLQIG